MECVLKMELNEQMKEDSRGEQPANPKWHGNLSHHMALKTVFMCIA